MSETDKGKGIASRQPTDWEVEDVNSWLKTSGFDDDIRHRFEGESWLLIQHSLDSMLLFTAHGISGKELFDLDIDILKLGMGIQAVGMQLRLVRAIDELRPRG